MCFLKGSLCASALWMFRNCIRWYNQPLGSYLATIPFSERPTFSICSSVLPLAPRTTIPKAADRLSGEKKMFSFLFLLFSSLKKSRQNLALAALREHIVALWSPETRVKNTLGFSSLHLLCLGALVRFFAIAWLNYSVLHGNPLLITFGISQWIWKPAPWVAEETHLQKQYSELSCFSSSCNSYGFVT